MQKEDQAQRVLMAARKRNDAHVTKKSNDLHDSYTSVMSPGLHVEYDNRNARQHPLNSVARARMRELEHDFFGHHSSLSKQVLEHRKSRNDMKKWRVQLWRKSFDDFETGRESSFFAVA